MTVRPTAPEQGERETLIGFQVLIKRPDGTEKIFEQVICIEPQHSKVFVAHMIDACLASIRQLIQGKVLS